MPSSYHSRLPEVIREAERKTTLAVQKTVLDIEAGAKRRTPPRVDTGLMMNSWAGRMTGDTEGEVSTGVDYARYHEYGTRYMSAHPMLIPSTEAAREPFVKAMRQVFE